jgi:hypothetical protein
MFVSIVSFCTETESFGILIELKQTEEQHKRAYFGIFSENLELFRFVSLCFSLFRNSLFRLFRFYTETESVNVSIEPK